MKTTTVVTSILAAATIILAAGPTAADVPESAWDVHPVLVGTRVPDISFVDERGGTFSLHERAGEKPLVLVIYRGLW